jgi:ABC-type dipeptide/oligopeptide/nickel transport system permease subunit
VPPALVSAGFGISAAILGESALSFLGFGVQAPAASWGTILASANDHLDRAWWLAAFPGLAIFTAAASFNIVADQLRRALDPKRRYSRASGILDGHPLPE